MKRPSVLILTSNFGSDHQQIATTLAKNLNSQGFNPVISDLFNESFPVMANIAQKCLQKIHSISTRMSNWFYFGNQKLHVKGFMHLSQSLSKKRLHSLMKEHRPVFIISTYPLQQAPSIKNHINNCIPLYTIITDYQIHPCSINPNQSATRYFVCSDSVKKTLLTHTIKEKVITNSGIPLRTKFENTKSLDTSSIYQKYYLSPHKKIITVLAGAHRTLNDIRELCQLLLQNPTHQIVAICKKNDRLFEKLIPLAYRYPDSFRLLEDVEEIHELLAISHFLVTKPNVITITEAAALQLPLILTKPTSVHEAENAHYFAEKGAAVTSSSIKETYEHIKQLSRNKVLVEKIKNELAKIHLESLPLNAQTRHRAGGLSPSAVTR